MAGTQLNATTSDGQQTSTQNPQTAGQSAISGAPAGSVQPGTSSDLLNGQGSVQLHDQPLTTVNLSAAPDVSPQPKPVAPPQHHFNPVLLLITAVLLLIAAGSVVSISRSSKNTTY